MSWQIVMSSGLDRRLRKESGNWGWIDLVVIPNEHLAGVSGYTTGDTPGSHFGTKEYAKHVLATGKEIRRSSVWYRARVDVPVTALHNYLTRRWEPEIQIDEFRQWVAGGWRHPPGDKTHAFTALLLDRSIDPPEWTAWNLTSAGATPANLLILDGDYDPFIQLEGHWPTNITRMAHVVLIGLGSIGSATADALVEYDIGTLSLVDPDRLLPHNLVRHRCGYHDVGRYKVDAVKEQLDARPGTRTINAYRWDAIYDADHLRPLLKKASIAICATDGVASRQAVSHLTRWATRSAVFSCVLDDGALGEIVRIRASTNSGCLSCLRRHLRAEGLMDPEPGIDRDYGEGTTHRPMTAVGGDLGLMGRFTAKAAVATLLEDAGYRDQRLPGDHIIIGLRPGGDLTPPFDVDTSLAIEAHPLPEPVAPCPSCFGIDQD